MNNKRLAVMSLFISAMLMSSVVLASTSVWDNLFTIVSPPPEPSTGNVMCTPYAVKNVRCSDFIKVYDQCIETMQGTEWQTRTENCQLHGEGWDCVNGECKYTGMVPGGFDLQAFIMQYWMWLLLIVAVIVLWKEKKIKF